MTLKLKILKNGVQTHGAESSQFESIEAFEAWKQQCIDSNVWGLPERPELDALGEPTGVVLPAEYTVEVEDLTEQVKAEKAAKEAKDKAKAERKDSRKALDWSKINTVAELKAIVKNLVVELED